jgi:non-homologous end joining protein Ku
LEGFPAAVIGDVPDFPATSESEKISFNQINRKTGHRIKYAKVDADTGEEVPSEDIIKGYKVDTDRYLEVSKDELDNIALESTRTIDIDEFAPAVRSTIFILLGLITLSRTARLVTTPTR